VKKTIAAATLIVALAAAIVVPTAAARESFDTELTVLDGATVNDDFLIHGYLASDKNKCVGNRKMQMLVDPGGGYVVRDTGRSSKSGAWAVWGEDDDATAIRVKVLRKRLGNGDICRAQAEDIAF